MALKIKIGKADHEALDDSLKTLYVADGDNFKLDADYEDVTGLKSKNAELLSDAKKFKEELKKFEGIDPEAARQAVEAARQAAEDKLKTENNWEGLRKQLEERHQAELEKLTAQITAIKSEQEADRQLLKRERLSNVLTEKGVLPDRVKYLVGEMDAQVELVTGEHGFELKKKDGVGDAKEFDLMIEGVKAKSPFFFAADNASGGGASGSNGRSNGAKTITLAQYEANPMQYAAQLASREITVVD